VFQNVVQPNLNKITEEHTIVFDSPSLSECTSQHVLCRSLESLSPCASSASHVSVRVTLLPEKLSLLLRNAVPQIEKRGTIDKCRFVEFGQVWVFQQHLISELVRLEKLSSRLSESPICPKLSRGKQQF